MSKFSYWGSVIQYQDGGLELTVPASWFPREDGQYFTFDGHQGAEFYDDLCNVVIFHYADVAHQAGNLLSRSNRRLIEAGYSRNGRTIDSEQVYQAYEGATLGHVRMMLGPEWIRQYDYWGAVCMCRGERPRGDQRKDHVVAGDTSAFVMFFQNAEALRQYVQRQR